MEGREKVKQLQQRISFRVSEKEGRRLDALLKKSRHRSRSALIRAALFRGKLTIVTYDRSLDIVMEQLSAIRTELHAIGVNINQATRKLHGEDALEARLARALEIAELYQQTDLKVTQLFTIIAKLSGKWLPG